MKKIVFVICAFFAITLFYSCKKCLNCSYVAGKNDSIQYALPEACGSKKDMQQFEDSLKKRSDEKRLPYYDSVSTPPKKYTNYKCVEVK